LLDRRSALAYKEVMPMALEKELATFRRELPRLLQTYRGKYALVHADKVSSVWPSVDDALKAGYEEFGTKPFLVKEIVETEEPRYFSRNLSRCR
jgi:hypothetical protein